MWGYGYRGCGNEIVLCGDNEEVMVLRCLVWCMQFLDCSICGWVCQVC